jgi:hypothetical protein
MGMLGLVLLGLGRFVAFLGDEVVDTFVVIHFLDVLQSYFLIKIIYLYLPTHLNANIISLSVKIPTNKGTSLTTFIVLMDLPSAILTPNYWFSFKVNLPFSMCLIVISQSYLS